MEAYEFPKVTFQQTDLPPDASVLTKTLHKHTAPMMLIHESKKKLKTVLKNQRMS